MRSRALGSVVIGSLVWLAAGPTNANGEAPRGGGRFCSATAASLATACRSQTTDDYYVARARCINVSDEDERDDCFAEAAAGRAEGSQLCRDQQETRLDACESLGEGRYDPVVDPARFDDPRHATRPNSYFPLSVGNRWVYGGDKRNVVEVVNETKRIAGVQCIVVSDLVFDGDDLVEDTDDWYAPAKDGSVWYFGEEVKDFESFDGDDPRVPELVSNDGSFKAGRDLDKPGIIFLASPSRGAVYVEEASLGNAEDVTEILSTSYAYGRDRVLDERVPPELAARFCSGDCVVTKNFSLLEPGIFARKYYARGIGVFLEVEVQTGEVVRLTDCNFDRRCASLPQP